MTYFIVYSPGHRPVHPADCDVVRALQPQPARHLHGHCHGLQQGTTAFPPQ
jgi:hypothetical protein